MYPQEENLTEKHTIPMVTEIYEENSSLFMTGILQKDKTSSLRNH
jgi:hypothetical protein